MLCFHDCVKMQKLEYRASNHYFFCFFMDKKCTFFRCVASDMAWRMTEGEWGGRGGILSLLSYGSQKWRGIWSGSLHALWLAMWPCWLYPLWWNHLPAMKTQGGDRTAQVTHVFSWGPATAWLVWPGLLRGLQNTKVRGHRGDRHSRPLSTGSKADSPLSFKSSNWRENAQSYFCVY